MANPWFRMYSEFSTDTKVQRMPENYQRRLLMIFCMRCNGDVTLHDEDVTFLLRISDQEWQETKAMFIDRGFMTKDGKVTNWDKRQYVSDSSRDRVAKHRALHKSVTGKDSNVTVTPPDTDTDTEQNKKTTRKSSLSKLIELGVNEQVARDWLVIRKTKKSPLTDTALKQIIAEAEKAKIPLPNVIEICAKENWAGFKASWEIPEQSRPNQPFNMDNFLKAVNG